MRSKWISEFVDPVDRQALKLENGEEQQDHIVSGQLVTADRLRQYPIIRGVPRFVPGQLYDEQQPIEDSAVQTGRSFGDLWRTDVNRRIGSEEAERASMQEQFYGMLGVTDQNELKDIFQDGMKALNAGCGVGWSEYLFNVNPLVDRFDVDLSLAVEEAFRNNAAGENVVVAQADLLSLPFREEYFDIIFSNGVLHHTASAPEAFDSLCRHLKPGGLIGIYIYNVKPMLREMADTEIRKTTTQWTFDEVREFSKSMTSLGKSFAAYDEPLIIEDDIPLLGIKKGRYKLQKFVYDHFVKCFYNREFGDEYSDLVNVDWYHPQNASHHTREEIERWFDKNSIGNVVFTDVKGWEHSGFFVSGRKKK